MEDTWTKVSLGSRDSKDTASAVILSTLPTFFWEQSDWLYWWWWCHWKLYLTDSFGRWHGRRFVVDLSEDLWTKVAPPYRNVLGLR